MLERLLQLVAEGGLHSFQDLGQRLSVPLPLLDMMLEDLVRLGYLRPVGDGCGSHCSGCAGGGCAVVGQGRVWSLTDKGMRAAARLPG